MAKKIAVCFFGITRSLRYTYPSIEKNILIPARAMGDVQIYAHFFKQAEIDNPRTGEHGALNLDEYKLLKSDWIKLEAPNECLGEWDFESLKEWGDDWADDFTSLRNLVHQLHSLHTVTAVVLESGADICIFCRPDLEYHASLSRVLDLAVKQEQNLVYLPSWETWFGLNDRFAICIGQDAIRAYGQRGQLAHDFCHEMKQPLHSESLVAYSLAKSRIKVQKIPERASRVRFDGTLVVEEFSRQIHRRLQRQGGLFAASLGMKPFIKKLLGYDD